MRKSRNGAGITREAWRFSLQVREVQVRLFVPPDRLRETVAFYKALTGGCCSLHFPFPERGLELASVSSPAVSFLIIAGDEANIRPFRDHETDHAG